MRILIVDDSRAMRLIVRRTLREAGFGHHEIAEAQNGVEALASIKKQLPHLILSDWNMPEMNGIQLLGSIAADRIPVKFGFVTSEGTDEIRERAEAAGALFLITKPFTPEIFREHLAPLLKEG